MAKKTQQIHPIYVIAGKEQALAKKMYRDLLDRLLEPEQHATGLWVADSKTPVDQVLDEVRTLPFLTDRRVVVGPEADEFITKHRPVLETYFDHPCPSGVLILIVKSFPATTKLAKKLKKAGELLSVAPPKPWQLPGHLAQYVQQTFGKKMTMDAAQLLVGLTGDDLTRLYSEAEKLVVFVGDTPGISARDVEALVGHNRVFGAFEVIDAMVAGRTGLALERLRNMFAEDKNAQYTVVGAFAFHVRRMFHAKALLSQGRSRTEVIKALRLWGKTDPFFAQVQKTSLPQLSRILQHLAEIDYHIKTGKTRAPVAIEQMVLRMA